MRSTLLATLFLALFGCQVSDSDNGGRLEWSPEGARLRGNEAVLGEWQGLPSADLGDGVGSEVLRIEPGQLSSVRTCVFEDGTEITVTATGEAEIQQKNITVFEPVEVTEESGGHTCTATLEAGVLIYGVVTEQMRVLKEGEIYTLTRVSGAR